MTSATGNRRTSIGDGFTLVEIVLVLGLIALAGAVVIANFVGIAERGDAQTTREILTEAIKEARFAAARERSIVGLRFNPEGLVGTLELTGGGQETFELGEEFGSEGRGEIRFFLVPAARGLAPQSDPERTTLEAQEIEFAPDRSGSPYVVEIDYGSGTPERIVFDPFSSLERRTPK